MASDYAEIARTNIEEYGRSTAVFDLVRDLYADRTHFIFELLQNAEDVGASFVRFDLRPEELMVKHDGRPFTTDDVIGICGVGVGTKAGDLTQIGRFGIGFKSVFGYTDTPIVRSGEEQFVIEHFVRPRAVAVDTSLKAGLTRFDIPFNRADVPALRAMDEIGAGLSRLEPNVLLFLRRIRRISIVTPDSHITLQRDEEPMDSYELVTVGGGSAATSMWLRFRRPIDSEGKLAAEIAFRAEDGEIRSLHRSRLVVFFPTEKETHLGFLVQGPYRTTPARENVPAEDEWNRLLIDETAGLLGDSLEVLRREGLLTVSALETLPISSLAFPPGSMFAPLFEAARSALQHRPLIPLHAGGHGPGVQAVLGRTAAIRELLAPDHLAQLRGVDRPVEWVHEDVSRETARALWQYLRDVLSMDEITPDWFIGRLTVDFLESQSDDWMVRFYRFLGDQTAQLRLGSPLHKQKFIRLEDGSHTTVFSEDGHPIAFLPVDRPTAFPVVRRTIAAAEGVEEVLRQAGLSEPDLVDEIREGILPLYVGNEPPRVEPEMNRQHLAMILQAIRESGRQRLDDLRGLLADVRFLLGVNAASGQLEYMSPSALHAKVTDLSILYDGNRDIWWVDDRYSLTSQDVDDLGITDRPRFNARRPRWDGVVVVESWWGYHVRGLDGFDRDADMEGLDFILANINDDRSRVLWSLLARQPRLIAGEIETATHQSFDNAVRSSEVSPMGAKLREAAWIPYDGTSVKPSEVSLDDLPESFRRSSQLAEALGMRSTLIDQLARQSGLDAVALKWVIDNPAELQRLYEASRAREVADRLEPEALEHPRLDEPLERTESERESSPPGPQSSRSTTETAEAIEPGTGRHGSSDGATPSNEGARVTYVSAHQGELIDQPPDPNRKRAEDAAMEAVLQFERSQGREPTLMPPNHPGYDVESTDGATTWYIEVKGLSGSWGSFGVPLTRKEFETARELGPNFWLYVVENAWTLPEITRVRNPALKVNTYVFDAGWITLPDLDEE